ncbi:SusC/RagA family TonB-linked outer membrane protein [Prevotella sp. ne3005]|jgi:TonB-linked SusC/RagA family outer membrane protein|uniref:SusC/RagA family TonB-linked outer membrane protein n=1 Tax=Prevotella sp. ne3005 TaxID=1761887 RepID=UPI000B85D113|nr:TonB-dependent receptor [Prevotella sp. ne3005]
MKKSRFLTMLLALMVSMASFAQDFSGILGTVIDENGDPVIGATVVEKAQPQNATITNIDGQFAIKVAEGTSLVISYVGYQTIEVKAKNLMSVTLKEDAQVLNDVVVIGYGVQKKSVVTAAISKVTGDDLNLTRPSRIEDALKGKVSGVQITQASGQPGSASKFTIRGSGSVNNSDPLYIVDGMAVEGGISYLNPVDIASVEILKDAASAAIYGARAANGVVLVTTKSGTSGKTTINYDVSFGWQNPWKKKAVLNAQQYMTIMNEAQVNDGNVPRYSADYIAGFQGNGTDWQDEVFNYNAPVQQHQVSVSGGNDKMNYFLSLGYFDQEGIVGGDYDRSNYNRWSLRSNSTYTVFEANNRTFLNKLKVGVNVGYSRAKSSGITTNTEYGSILGSALTFSPLQPVYLSEEEGKALLAEQPYAITKNGRVFSLPPTGFQELTNPVATLNQPAHGYNNEDKFVASFYAELDVLPGLKFKSSYGADLAFWGYDGYGMQDYRGTMAHTDQSWVSSSMNRGFRWQVENVLTYQKTFAEKHNLTVVLGQSANRYTYRNLSGNDYQLLDTDPLKANIDYAIADRSEERVSGGTGGYDKASLASYFGRLDYNFDERYMIQFTLRRDGSSVFGTNNKWATFPAVSLGWNVLNEPYLQKVKPSWFNVMKIRASWGQNGNASIGNFLYMSLMDGGENYYFGGSYNPQSQTNDGSMVYGSSPGRVANPDVKWETSEQIDLGVDLRFFDSRLSFSFDYFKKKTKDMLAYMPVPTYIGQSSPMGNLGKMENWGYEFEFGWKDHVKDFSYYFNGNISILKNKMVDLGNESGETDYEGAGAGGVGTYVHAKNGDVWPYFYGLKTNGLFQNWDEVNSYTNANGGLIQPNAHPGDVRFVDVDGDGSIGSGDRTKIGKGAPDVTFGFTLGAEWKGFDFNAAFQGTLGNDVFDFAQRGDVPAMNRPSWIMDRWHGEGTSNKIPRMTSANPNGNWQSSDLFIKNGSYMRLKTIQLGYTLPQNLTRVASIQRLRFYVSAENLLTITGYDGFDPELGGGDGASATAMGVDKGIYPQSRTIYVGANITF